MSEEVVSRAEFDALYREFQDLKKRLASLQKTVDSSEEVSEETAQVIAAAVAAYLGKRATTRIVRVVVGPDQWRLQGRAALQASHTMPRTQALNR